MSYEITFTGGDGTDPGGESFHLANNSEWGAFIAWAESLPGGGFAHVKELADEGETADTAALVAELAEALKEHPPGGGVAALVEHMIEIIGNGESAETATVES